MMTSMDLTLVHGEHLHLNTSSQIKPPPLKQERHFSKLGLQTPSVENGDDKAPQAMGGLGRVAGK